MTCVIFDDRRVTTTTVCIFYTSYVSRSVKSDDQIPPTRPVIHSSEIGGTHYPCNTLHVKEVQRISLSTNDIKPESTSIPPPLILLVASFSVRYPDNKILRRLPSRRAKPLIKLTDFRLVRKIYPDNQSHGHGTHCSS